MATCNINLRKHPTKKATALKSHLLFKGVGDMLLQDVSDVIAQIANCEMDEQARSGNDATHTFLNNRPATLGKFRRQGPTGQFTFRARVLFGQTTDIIDATIDAFRLLRSLTRVSTGAALRSYHVYLGNTGNTSNPGKFIGAGLSALKSLREEVTENSMVSIIGPNVIYGRKLYWSPVGGKTVKKRLARPQKGFGAIVRIKTPLDGLSTGFRGTLAIHSDVKKRMARNTKYKSLSFGDPFYVMNNTNIIGDRRVPAISIMSKAVGRLN